MKFKKEELLEIIDSNGELIGNNDTPTNGSNLETAANNTTDYNAKIGQQPFRFDMLGRFGFSLMPFMEGEENNINTNINFEELMKVSQEIYLQTLEYYYRNPNKLKSDFRNLSDTENPKRNKELSTKFYELLKQFKKGDNSSEENIDESKVVEDKIVNKKTEDEMSKKSEDNEIKDKKLQKVAGLINKLEKKDIDKLINLLERK